MFSYIFNREREKKGGRQRDRDRNRDREGDTETETETERQTSRQTVRQTVIRADRGALRHKSNAKEADIQPERQRNTGRAGV